MVEGIKFLDGYASKFSRCIDKTNLKLSGLKIHDFHVIMQRLLLFSFIEPSSSLRTKIHNQSEESKLQIIFFFITDKFSLSI